jgi:tetratricopeptide (TPR) repeat protein
VGRLYVNAMEGIERGGLDSAESGLDRALHCDPKFRVALSARALVTALRAQKAGDTTQRDAYQKRAHADLVAGAAGLSSPEEHFLHEVTAIRAITALQDTRWLDQATALYERARGLSVEESKLLYYGEPEALPYFMAEAFLTAGEYEKARTLYHQVFERHGVGRWNGKAEAGWQRTDKIIRATAGITSEGIGRHIAVQPTVTRAQLAALLVEDVGLGKLLDSAMADTPRLVPADTRDSPYREQIVRVLGWHLRGIELVYDNTAQAYLFQPDAPVRRKELAIALEDIVIRLAGDPSAARAFIGHDKSLFTDVAPTAAWYNACATAVSRGLMESDVEGAFRPDANVEGADALLAARVLRQKMIGN